MESNKQKTNRILRHASESEKAIEPALREAITAIGLLCLKYSNPNEAGYPDRLIVCPDGMVVWVELKSKGRRPDKRQLLRHEQLRALGHDVRVIDTRAGVDALRDELLNTYGHRHGV